MKLNDTIVKRIEEICNERKSNVCDTSIISMTREKKEIFSEVLKKHLLYATI